MENQDTAAESQSKKSELVETIKAKIKELQGLVGELEQTDSKSVLFCCFGYEDDTAMAVTGMSDELSLTIAHVLVNEPGLISVMENATESSIGFLKQNEAESSGE